MPEKHFKDYTIIFVAIISFLAVATIIYMWLQNNNIIPPINIIKKMIIKSFIADKPIPIKSSLRISFKRIYNLFNGYISPSAGMLFKYHLNTQLVK